MHPNALCIGCTRSGGISGGGGSGGGGPAREGLVATSELKRDATSEEPIRAEEPAREGLMATRALDEDAAAEQFMPAEGAVAEWPIARGTSCSWRCPEQSKHKILYA